ncbi:RNA pseudouridine synthase [Pararcticibacter amylolyticus]|uniref:RNA pseudouridine synthase n=2 Tax=Pararcticibacter amylolyticus TaxID=2173175 RepID=A0A2U2PAG8_9SPHI|nr:RNA pseudouridine synthase [Pararcticibacter amylolyticus]
MSGGAFHQFNENIPEGPLPEKFTYPFCYEAHPLARMAASQVRDFLNSSYDNEHNFGIDPEHEGMVIGKMFGVLVVKTPENQTGFLAAYSGKLAQGRQHPYFVPPVYDVFQEDGMYLNELKNLVALNEDVDSLEEDGTFLALRKSFAETQKLADAEISEWKRKLRMWKKERDQRRNEGRQSLKEEEFAGLQDVLRNESLKQKFDLRILSASWQEKISDIEKKISQHQQKIDQLKDERKNRSASLQVRLFENYRFLNARKEWKSLLSIFTEQSGLTPPAGAGECAAPKLLQYAYLHNLQPIAMAEFWWGQSPKSEVRKHGEFYPACRGKCGPILTFMMEGLQVDDNPLETNPANGKEISIVFEDDDILVISKPAEFLSVPGKFVTDSVQTRIQRLYPRATLVHRLDQSTSGIILVGKHYDAYVYLQKQFVKRTVAKRYLAVLDGILEEDEGIIDLPLRVDLDNRPQQMVCYEHGKPAQTRYKVQKRVNGRTYIHFYPVTGRTHQLRVHAAHSSGLNIPIAGDDLYGTKDTRLFLHAEYLEFTHPTTRERLSFTVPADFDI